MSNDMREKMKIILLLGLAAFGAGLIGAFIWKNRNIRTYSSEPMPSAAIIFPPPTISPLVTPPRFPPSIRPPTSLPPQ